MVGVLYCCITSVSVDRGVFISYSYFFFLKIPPNFTPKVVIKKKISGNIQNGMGVSNMSYEWDYFIWKNNFV